MMRIVSSEEEEEFPEEHCSITKKSKRKCIQAKNLSHHNSSHSEEDLVCSKKNGKTIKRPKLIVNSSSDSEDNYHKNSRETQRQKLTSLSLKRNPNFKNSSDIEDESQILSKNCINDYVQNEEKSANLEDDKSNDQFRVITTRHPSKYPGKCALVECKQRFTQGITEIVGCELFDKLSGDYEQKFLKSGRLGPYWICAKHLDHITSEESDECESQYDSSSDVESNN